MGFFNRVKIWFRPNLEPPQESEREKSAKRIRDECADDLVCALSERRQTHINDRIDRISRHLDSAIGKS